MTGIQHSTDLCQRWWDCTTGLGDDWSFFCWKSSALQSGWLETQVDDGTRFSFRQWNTPLPFCYCNTCRGNGMLIQASCPASLQGGIRIHGDAWKGILIQASPPASLRDSCGCLEWDPHSCILSCLIKRWNWHLCFQRQNKPDDSTGVLILQVDPLLLVPGKRVHPNKEVPRKLHPCQSHSLAPKGNHKIYVYVRSILWHTFGPTEIWSILPDILVDGWK